MRESDRRIGAPKKESYVATQGILKQEDCAALPQFVVVDLGKLCQMPQQAES